jgi:2-methylisocitrate lyase-like PEP mutase family enzyme
MDQKEKATLLRALHKRGDPVIFVNAWDAGSARIIEEAGAKAIATTSAGLAQALGYPDGQKLPWNELIAAVRRIVRVVKLPVTTDIEAGFASNPRDLQRNMEELIDAGAVGVNLEDFVHDGQKKKLYPAEEQVARIQAVRKAGDKKGVPLVINARTDAYWVDPTQSEESRIEQTITRGRAYIRAGADCIFIPGAVDLHVISRLVEGIDSCVNVLAMKGAPPIGELARAGVARVSVGSGLFRSAYTKTRLNAQEVLQRGTYAGFIEGTFPYEDFNRLFKG